jgi:lysophospholipase L1-like esterase
MRDREYATAKPPHTFRIGFVGDSIGSGWGVNDGAAFESRLEQTLDARSRRSGGPTVEILNFAVPGHGPGQRWDHFSRLGWPLAPDLVIFESTLADAGWDERRLRGLLPRGIGWDVPMYRAALAAAKAQPGGTAETYKRALRPFRDAFFAGVYRAVVDDCRAHGVPSVLVVVPRVGKAPDPAERRRLLAMAHDAGFTLVVDLTDAYDGVDPAALAIGPDDFHPNADGHARLARGLDAALRRLPELARLGNDSNRPNQSQGQGADTP